MNLSHHAEQAISTVTGKATIVIGAAVGTSGAAEKMGALEFLGTHSAAISSMCMIGGFGIAILTFLTNVYFQHKRSTKILGNTQP